MSPDYRLCAVTPVRAMAAMAETGGALVPLVAYEENQRSRASRTRHPAEALPDRVLPQRTNVGVSANPPTTRRSCAARVGALRTFGMPLNHRARNPSERNRCSKARCVVEHADATITSDEGEH